MNILKTLCLVLFCACLVPLKGQQLDHVLGEIIVQTENPTAIHLLINQYASFNGNATQLQMGKKLKTPGHIYTLRFNHNIVNERALLQQLRQKPEVVLAQFNHLLSERQTVPNDPSFNQQWHWITTNDVTGAIDADLAWDISTGGLTPEGDEIVIAIIDDGTEMDHPDLAANVWTNSNEIADNGIDDDNNGYIDDFEGWNINRDDDSVRVDNFGPGHGVSVAGMAGAIGNNAVGATGVNWKVKLMTVKNTGGIEEALVLEAYAYPLAMRQLYNSTNGQKGAFVVAANSSWGLNFAEPADAPIWCNFYDTMGDAGILSCAATTNLDINVDTQGDLPTTCTSEYLLAVTRSGKEQEQGGGFGPINIDLAAPGIAVYTTEKDQSYGFNTGTSLSSPLVAGMIGFLYSIPNNHISSLAKADPGAASILARQYILDGVKQASGYETLVASGGIANLNNSVQMVLADIGACLAPFGLKVTDRTDVKVTLNWTPGNSVTSTRLRWRRLGTGAWNEEGQVTAPFDLTGLTPCTDYEFQVSAACGSENSGYSDSKVFASEGCCVPPGDLVFKNIGETSAEANWEAIFAAVSYDVSIREEGTSSWINFSSATNSYLFDNLEPCATYDVRVRTVCASGVTVFGEQVSLSTFGCGNCEDLPYCVVERSTEFEYIDKVVVAGVENQSGDNDGYAQFFSLPIEMKIGDTYAIELTPGYPGFNYTEDFEVWIDYNQDGDFEDPGEKVLFIENLSETVSGEITIPETAPAGATRMRVTLYFMGPSMPCDDNEAGEIEDYCITIVGEPNGCEASPKLEATVIDDFNVQLNWDSVTDVDSYKVIWKKINSSVWQEQTVNTNSYLLGNLTSCTEYDYQVQSICTTGESPFSSNFPFKTKCLSATEEPTLGLSSIKVSPNPFTGSVYIDFVLDQTTPVSFEIWNSNGQILRQMPTQTFSAGTQGITISDLENLSGGIYFLRLKTPKAGDKFIKLVKIK